MDSIQTHKVTKLSCKDIRFQYYCGNINYLEEKTGIKKMKALKKCYSELH